MSHRVRLLLILGALAGSLQAEWLEVNSANQPVTIETTGIVTSKNTTRFSPPPSFYWNLTIAEIVQEGQRVGVGDVIARFESTQESTRLTQIQEQLNVAQGELTSLTEQHNQEIETEKLILAEAESNAEKARRKANQPIDLVPSIEYKKLVKQRELAEQMVEHHARRAEISAKIRETNSRRLRLHVQRKQNELHSIQQALARFTIRSPREGIAVVGTNYNGEKYDVGSTTQPHNVIAELVDQTALEISSTVREQYSAQLQLNQPVRMVADSLGGLNLTGRVSELGKSVRRKSRFSSDMVREFKVELDSQPEILKLGTSTKTTVEVRRRPSSIAVPRSAIQYREGFPGVVTQDGWAKVSLGERSDDKIIVVEGLIDGDSISI